MGVCCARNVEASVEAHRGPSKGSRRRKTAASAACPGEEEDEDEAALSPADAPGGLPPFFAEVLAELERHRRQLGGLKHFSERPYIERKMKRKELATSHSDYEYIYLTILGLARLHLRSEEIIKKNNGQTFTRNPGVQMLERVTGLTMHAERGGSEHLLRTAPASLIEAFQLARADPGGPLKFFKTAFDRTADPCLEGRMGRIMEYIESRRRAAHPAACMAPPWEDVTLRSLPEGASAQEVVGEHLRVFVAECTWRWAQMHGLSYEAAVQARQSDENAADFARLCNAAAFEAAMLARGVAAEACAAHWESATKSGEWIPYEADVSLQIEQAHQKGLAEVKVRLGPRSWLYVIDLRLAVQRNPKTGQERPMRRVEASASDDGAAQPRRPGGRLSREDLAAAVQAFVELATLAPAPEEAGAAAATPLEAAGTAVDAASPEGAASSSASSPEGAVSLLAPDGGAPAVNCPESPATAATAMAAAAAPPCEAADAPCGQQG